MNGHVAAGGQPAQLDREKENQENAEKKVGMAPPEIAITVVIRSTIELCLTAEITPAGMPITI